MASGLTPPLCLAALVVGSLGFLILRRHLPPLPALLVVLVKVGLPVAYFAWFYTGQWSFLDDISYWRHGRILMAAGYSPFTILFRRQGLAFLAVLALGPHILYSWWNLLAQYIFGPYYYAPVLMNVGLTFISGALLVRLGRLFGFGRQYIRWLLVFYLLHWEALAWSSFINLKDVPIETLTIAALYLLLRSSDPNLRKERRVVAGIGAAAVLATLPWLRFYSPVLILGTFGLWVLLKRAGWKKYLVLLCAVGGLVLALPRAIPSQLLVFSPPAVAVNLVRVALTPRPWSVDPAYSFLQIASVLHWLMIVPAMVGAYLLWRRSPAASLLVLYLVVVTLFYAVVPEIITPRNRVQVLFIWAWVEFEAIYSLLVFLSRRWREPVSRTPATPHTSQAVGA